MKKLYLFVFFLSTLFTQNLYSQNTLTRGGIFTDEQWKKYDMVKRWMDSSQSVVIKPSVQKQLDDYCLKYPQNKSIVFRYSTFVRAMLNEKFTIDERLQVANYIKDSFKEYSKDSLFPIYVIDGIIKELNKIKLQASNTYK